MSDQLETHIVEILQQEKECHSSKLAKKLKIERHTLAKYLEKLKAQGKIMLKQVGMAKVWSLTPVPIISTLKDHQELNQLFQSLDENILIIDENKQILWSNKETVHKKCFQKNFHKEKICKDCPAEYTLLTGKEKSNKNLTTIPIKDKNQKVIAIMEILRKRK